MVAVRFLLYTLGFACCVLAAVGGAMFCIAGLLAVFGQTIGGVVILTVLALGLGAHWTYTTH